jgi:uncharacterized repeat protein (TIGR02543 family)
VLGKKVISLISSAALLLTVMPAASAKAQSYSQGDYDDALYREGGYDAGYDPNYISEDTQETKYFFKENFTYTECAGRDTYAVSNSAPDGWDCSIGGGSLKGKYYTGDYQLIDTSETAPVRISRSFEKADHGKVTLEAQLKIGANMDGVSLSLYSGPTEAIRLETLGGKMYLDRPGGTDTELFSYTADSFFGLKLEIDIDAQKVTGVYVNGSKVKENLDFGIKKGYLDKFAASTGVAATGTLSFNMVHMYRGYYLNEKFTSSMQNVPSEFSEKSGVSAVTKTSAMRPDIYSLKLDGTSAKAYAKRTFDTASGNLKFSVNVYSETANNMKVSLTKDGADAIAININNGKVSCGGAQADFKTGIWNKLTIETDSESKTAKLFVNYREAKGSIPYTAESVNGVSVETTGDSIITDDFTLEPIYPLPSDYVPAIEKADSNGYYIGMQMFPAWDEGSHSGWDFENSVKAKTPYLGYYDQDSPEAIDWTIKQLAEHGVDFMKVTWFPPYDKNVTKSAYIGGTFMDAYFNSEYKDQMPFMIMWENSASNNTADEMINHFAPYWIEYYFKNDNYFKIGGRPVFQIYSPSSFVNCSGGAENCKNAIAQFKQMCVNAGVGEPIVISAYDTTLANEIGCEAAIPYWLGGATNFAENAYKMAENASSLGITTYPVMGSGIFDIGKNATLTPQEFKSQLTDLKNNYYTKYNNAGPLGNMLMLATYDEYSEGHWLAPSGLYGFGYLDAVREVFTSNTAHTDTVPTASQRDRFNNLYPDGREVKQLSTETKGDGSKENLTVKKGWYFNGTTTEDWNGGGISPVAVSNGTIKGTVSNTDPQLAIYGLNLDVTDVTYLKVRYKSTVTDNLQIFFTSDSAPKMSELNSLRCYVPNTDWNDLYINVGNLFNFTGTLTSLRIDTGSTVGAQFEIDSIELLSDPRLSDVHFSLTTSDGDVYQWDGSETNISYANGILTATVTKEGNSVYFKGLPDGVTCPFDDYRYVVFKLETIPDNEKFSVYVCGSEGIKSEGQRFNNMIRYDDGGYTYCIFDLSAKTLESMQAQGLWQGGNLTLLRFTTNQGGTYKIADVYVSNESPMPELSEFSISADADAIYTDEGSVKLTPHIKLSSGSEISDISNVTWTVSSVNAAAKINSDNTLTLTGKVNGEVTVTAYYTYAGKEYSADYTVTVSGQTYRIPTRKMKILAYGNSILGPYPPTPSLGWSGNWGMAASAENKDYIHRLMDMFGEKYGRENVSWVKGYGFGNFEVDLANGQEGQDWSEYLSGLKDCAAAENPDVIIVQYGENTNLGLSGYHGTQAGYRDGLIQFVQELKKGAPDALVLLTTPFWGGNGKINGAKAAAAALNVPIAELAPLTTEENEALDGPDEWANGVKIHPGDKGMLRIAEAMYKQLNIALTKNDNVVYSLSPESLSIKADKTAITDNNGTAQLTVSASPSSAATDVSWSTSNSDIATVDENGLVKAVRDGEVTITAVSKYNSSVFGSIKITVSGQRPFYTVTYNANTTDTVSGMPEAESTKAETLSLAGKYPLRDEYNFVGWSTSENGEVIDTLTVTGDTTLYAIWEIADSWTFDRDGYAEGFTIDYGFHQSVANGVLKALETGYTAETAMKINSPKLNLSANDYAALKIKMQNAAYNESTVITLTVHASGGDKVFTYPVTTTEFTEYTADLSDISGTITGFDFTPTNMDCEIDVDEIYFERVDKFELVSTTLPEEGRNTSIGYNRYSMTFSKAINTLSLKLGETDITDYTISDDKKTVEFGVNLPSAGSKTLTAAVTDNEGTEIKLTRTLRVRSDGWVAYTDFDGSLSGVGQAWRYLQNTDKFEMSQAVTHSGTWSVYSTTGFTGDVHTWLQNWSWASTHWNENTAKTEPNSKGEYTYKLTKGEKYKFSYWVYADEGASVTTPRVLVKKSNGGYEPWLISNENYASLPKQQWNYFEAEFTAETTELPFFWKTPGCLYIDDVRLEKLSAAPELVSTTLPSEGENAPLGYNRYTMTFDKDIDSVTSFKLGGTALTDYTVSENTIEFGLRLIEAGDKTLELTIKDTDGVSAAVSRTITVPNTLVAYADFDSTMDKVSVVHYFDDGAGQASFVTDAGEYHSPGRAALLDYTKAETLKLGNQSYSLLYGSRKLTPGKYYKLSFWAKRTDSNVTPSLAPAHNNLVLNNQQWLQINSDVMTKYEVTFRAAKNEMPWFFGGVHDGNIIIDDILIEETQPSLSLSADAITAGAKITASLTNDDVPEGVSATVIIALYKDNILQKVKTVPATALKRGGTVTTEAVTVPSDISDGNYKVSAFAWQDLSETLLPICAPLTLTE